jgi:hypothetical protein
LKQQQYADARQDDAAHQAAVASHAIPSPALSTVRVHLKNLPNAIVTG